MGAEHRPRREARGAEARRPDAGFTLVEVLVALVILAVGMLGLEAMAIRVARSVALAERQSRHAVLASDSLETALELLRRTQSAVGGALPAAFCQVVEPHGDRLSRRVVVSGNLGEVTVAVLPEPTASMVVPEPLVLRSVVFLPTPPGGTVRGSPCS